jgi:hypothetical protein
VPSSIPFEQRYRPPDPRSRRRERLTRTDRVVCAITGGFLGFVLWTVGYLLMLLAFFKAAARQPAAVPPIDPFDWLPSYSWGFLAAAGFAAFGAVVGAERMMDGFVAVLGVEGMFAKHS